MLYSYLEVIVIECKTFHKKEAYLKIYLMQTTGGGIPNCHR